MSFVASILLAGAVGFIFGIYVMVGKVEEWKRRALGAEEIVRSAFS